MVLIRSFPALILFIVGIAMALLSHQTKKKQIAAFGCMTCVTGLILLILLENGTLYEALACLLSLLFLMLPYGDIT